MVTIFTEARQFLTPYGINTVQWIKKITGDPVFFLQQN